MVKCMSPDSANLVMSSGNIIRIAVQSQVTVIHDQDNGTDDDDDDDDDEDDIIFKTADPSGRLPNLKLSLNNNLPVSSYSHLPAPESVIFYEDPEADDDFLVTHRSPRLEDEKSSTS